MPGSNSFGKKQTLAWFKDHKQYVSKVLDLGPGKGNYEALLKPELPHLNLTGVEAFVPYIDKYKLNDRYDQIIVGDVRYVDWKKVGDFDVVIAGDILEHMTKEEAIKMADEMLEIAPTLIISIPVVHYPQGKMYDNPFEAHVKDDWSHEEMLQTFGHLVFDSVYEDGQKVAVYFLRKP